MNVKQTVAALAAIGCVAGAAMAQQQAAAKEVYLKAGTMEVGLNGGYTMFEDKTGGGGGVDTDLSQLLVTGEFNYFVIDNLSVGLDANGSWMNFEIKGGSEVDTVMLYGEPVVRYHIPVMDGRMIPYVGASVGEGYAWANLRAGTSGGYHAAKDDTFWTYSGQVGFKVPLNQNVLFDTCLKYTDYQLPSSWNTELHSTAILFGLKMKL